MSNDEYYQVRLHFLDELKGALTHTQFHIVDMMGQKIQGEPKGVKELKLLMAHFENEKDNTGKVINLFKKVLESLHDSAAHKADHQFAEVGAFYNSWYQKASLILSNKSKQKMNLR